MLEYIKKSLDINAKKKQTKNDNVNIWFGLFV